MSFMISLTGASGTDMYTDPTVIIKYNLGTMFPAYLLSAESPQEHASFTH